MKTASLLVSLLLCLLSSNAFAGVETNGGDAVHCQGRPLEMLDFYQAKLPSVSGSVAIVDVDRMSASGVIDFIENRLRRFKLFPAYLAAKARVGDIGKWRLAPLSEIDDSGLAFPLPPDCHLVQAATRQGSIVFVDPAVLSDLSEGQKGVLILHETLYSLFESYGASRTRVLLGDLLAKTLNERQFVQDLNSVGVREYFYQDLPDDLWSLKANGRDSCLGCVKFATGSFDTNELLMFEYSSETHRIGEQAVFNCDVPKRSCTSKQAPALLTRLINCKYDPSRPVKLLYEPKNGSYKFKIPTRKVLLCGDETTVLLKRAE